MKEGPQTGRMTVSFEELAYSNMAVVEALVELLTEKKILARQEIIEGAAGVREQTRANFRKLT